MIDANKTLRSIISSLNYEYRELKESCPELLEECKETLKEYTELLLNAAAAAAADKANFTQSKSKLSGYNKQHLKESIAENGDYIWINKESITSIINDINFD